MYNNFGQFNSTSSNGTGNLCNIPYYQPDMAMCDSSTTGLSHIEIQWNQVVPMDPAVPQNPANLQWVAAPNDQFMDQPGLKGLAMPPAWTGGRVLNGKKPKRIRTAFTTDQIMHLEREYARNRYLDRARRLELANLLQLQDRTLKVWFQNRRMKEKKEVNEANMQLLHPQMPVANVNMPAIPVASPTTVGIGSLPTVSTPSLMFSEAPAQLNREVEVEKLLSVECAGSYPSDLTPSIDAFYIQDSSLSLPWLKDIILN